MLESFGISLRKRVKNASYCTIAESTRVGISEGDYLIAVNGISIEGEDIEENNGKGKTVVINIE